MKICIAGSNTSAKTGKGFFVNRLTTALEKRGIVVTADIHKKVDIALHVGHIRYESRARKNVLRVGPARVSKHENYEKLNAIRAKSIKIADGVVFQSKYSKKVTKHFVCKPHCPTTVIHNGADYDWYDSVVPKEGVEPPSFVASTRKWIPQKRLRDIIVAFGMAKVEGSKLYILGNSLGQKDRYKDVEGVVFVGECNQETIGSYLKAATAMVHIVYLDACPNSVVEAVSARCPVICTDQGGTKELVEDWPHWVVQDKPFKYEPVNLSSPPKIDREVLAMAMRKAAVAQWEPMERPLRTDIGYVANQYLMFFEEVLG